MIAGSNGTAQTLLYDHSGHEKPQSGTPTGMFGTEVGLKDFFKFVLFNPLGIVLYTEEYILLIVCDLYKDLPMLLLCLQQCLFGILQEIDKDLCELIGDTQQGNAFA